MKARRARQTDKDCIEGMTDGPGIIESNCRRWKLPRKKAEMEENRKRRTGQNGEKSDLRWIKRMEWKEIAFLVGEGRGEVPHATPRSPSVLRLFKPTFPHFIQRN